MKNPIIRAVIFTDNTGPYFFTVKGKALDDNGKTIDWGFSTGNPERFEQELGYIKGNFEAQIVREYRIESIDYGH